MDTLIFSQSAIFRLQQLGSHYYHYSGVRHKLATPEGILDLLKAAALAEETNVRACYDAFVMELNKRQIDALSDRGVMLRPPLNLSRSGAIRKAS
jgi:hypothetical protein